MNELTEEQKARIAENRAKALQRLEERKKRLATNESFIMTEKQQNALKILSEKINNKGLDSLNAPPIKKSINEMAKINTINNNNNNFNSNKNFTHSYIPIIKVNFIIANVEFLKVNI